MEINEEKRKKFMEYAEKRVNNVMHDISILEPMARSNSYDFTKADVEAMFGAMQKSLDTAKEEYYKKFEVKARTEKKSFSFGAHIENNLTGETITVEEEIPEVSEVGIMDTPDEITTEIF